MQMKNELNVEFFIILEGGNLSMRELQAIYRQHSTRVVPPVDE